MVKKINICEIRKSYYDIKNILYCYFYIFFIRFIIMSNNFNSSIDEYEFLSNSLNKIFKNNNKEIKNLLLKNNIKTINTKISFFFKCTII